MGPSQRGSLALSLLPDKRHPAPCKQRGAALPLPECSDPDPELCACWGEGLGETGLSSGRHDPICSQGLLAYCTTAGNGNQAVFSALGLVQVSVALCVELDFLAFVFGVCRGTCSFVQPLVSCKGCAGPLLSPRRGGWTAPLLQAACLPCACRNLIFLRAG